jgi:hypothetical protein
MGFDEPLRGHVESLTRGISDQNAEAGAGGLASVNPVFTWVGLDLGKLGFLEISGDPERLLVNLTCTVNLDTPKDISSDAGFLLHC